MVEEKNKEIADENCQLKARRKVATNKTALRGKRSRAKGRKLIQVSHKKLGKAFEKSTFKERSSSRNQNYFGINGHH